MPSWKDAESQLVPEVSLSAERRHFLRLGLTAAIASGFTPSARAIDQSIAAVELRGPISRPFDMALYSLHMPPEYPSTWIFGSGGAPAIPAGFFGTGSDPWIGEVSCVGVPFDPKGPIPTADLVVEHEAVDWVSNPEKHFGPREIPRNFRIRCNMKRLSERGTGPLTVTYDGGKRSEKWDVLVGMADDHPGGGHIDITWLDADGISGLCDIEIAVKVAFKFTNRDSKREVVLVSGIEWLSETNHNFVRRADTAVLSQFYLSQSANGNFIPATRNIGGEMQAKAGCSKNSRVAHSFIVAPRKEVLQGIPAGMFGQIKQFPPRKE